jgi:hypothetical protein
LKVDIKEKKWEEGGYENKKELKNAEQSGARDME